MNKGMFLLIGVFIGLLITNILGKPSLLQIGLLALGVVVGWIIRLVILNKQSRQKYTKFPKFNK